MNLNEEAHYKNYCVQMLLFLARLEEGRHLRPRLLAVNIKEQLVKSSSAPPMFNILRRIVSMGILPSASSLIWIDLEMTGLDPQIDRILELAILITDSDLNILAEWGPKVIYRPAHLFQEMNPWCQKMHTKTGLWDRVQASQESEESVQASTLEFLEKWVPCGVSPACGNTVFHDRKFLARYMPKLEQYFHYRCLDVSTLKELVRRWAPQILTQWKKSHPHQALLDIHQSVQELRFYRAHLFSGLEDETSKRAPKEHQASKIAEA